MVIFGILYILMWVLTASAWYAYDVVNKSRGSAESELPLTVVASSVWPAMLLLFLLYFSVTKLGNRMVSHLNRRSE